MLACPQPFVPKENKILTVRLPEALHRAMRIKVAQEGISSFQDLVLSLIEGWISGSPSRGAERSENSHPVDSGISVPPSVEVVNPGTNAYTKVENSSDDREWIISLCREVIYSDDPIAGVALAANAISFHRMLTTTPGETPYTHGASDPTVSARIERIRESNEAITRAIEEIRRKSAGAGLPVPSNRDKRPA